MTLDAGEIDRDKRPHVVVVNDKPTSIHDEQELHAVLYADADIVLTEYECCYAVWKADTGRLIHGRLWGNDDAFHIAKPCLAELRADAQPPYWREAVAFADAMVAFRRAADEGPSTHAIANAAEQAMFAARAAYERAKAAAGGAP